MIFAFLHPWWLLLLALWPLLLMLLRRRDQKREQLAPDFLLWRRAAATLPAAASRARLSWRDLAWVAPLILLTGGLAEPEVCRSSAPVEVVVLADPSPSMQTRDETGATRLDRGLAEARRLLGSRPHRVETGTPAIADDALMLHAAGVPVLVVTDRSQPALPAEVGLVVVADGARNAGIVAAGFDRDRGLMIRVEADPGAGPRTLAVRDGQGAEIIRNTLADPPFLRTIIPAHMAMSVPHPITIRLEPSDALPLDDEVRLESGAASVRVVVPDGAPQSLERALRACPGVTVVHGEDTEAIRILVASVAGARGFETGAAAPQSGGLSGPPPFDDLEGPSSWNAVFPLLKRPAGAEILLSAGGAPLLVRHARTFVLLVDPDASGWAALPSFPLAIARLVEVAGAGSGTPLVPAPGSILSADVTHVMREGPPPPPRAPVARESSPPPAALAPWCFAAAAAIMAALVLLGMLKSRARSR